MASFQAEWFQTLADEQAKFGLNHNVIDRSCKSSVLFSSYTALVNHVSLSPFTEDTRNLIVLGQPGSGKSSAIVHLMAEAMRRGISVMYSTALEPTTFYGWSGEQGPELYNADNILLMDENMMWFQDLRAHGPCAECRGKIVLFCTPQSENFEELYSHSNNSNNSSSNRSPTCKVYLPLPTAEEVFAVSVVQGLPYSWAEINQRISVVGRVPRNVCAVDFAAAEDQIQYALQHCQFNPHNVLLSQAVDDDGADVSHVLFATNADPTQLTLQAESFLSVEIERRYMRAWYDKADSTMMTFLRSHNTIAGHEGPYAAAFRVHAHQQLQQENTLQLVKLSYLGDDTGAPKRFVEKFKTKASMVQQIKSFEEFTLLSPVHHDSCFWQLNAPNRETVVDAIVLQGPKLGSLGAVTTFYKMTASLTPGINAAELNTLMASVEAILGEAAFSKRTFLLVFVVPAYLFTAMKRQVYSHGEVLPRYRARVLQAVIGIDLGS